MDGLQLNSNNHLLTLLTQLLGTIIPNWLRSRNHQPEVVTAMEPIDISSSDSDFDMDFDLDDSSEVDILSMTGPTTSRVLPSWTSTGNGRQSENVDSSKRLAFIGSLSTAYNHSPSTLQHRSGSSADTRTLNCQIVGVDDSRHVKGNGNAGHQVSNAQFKDPGNSFHLSGSSSKGIMRDHVDRANNDEIVMYENRGSRVLPPSLVHGKSISTPQFASSSDNAYHSGMGPDGVAGNDERLIYQAVVEDLNQSKLEATSSDGLLSVSLLRHQKIALAWMLQKETKSCHCLSGILADDQGLGKTISMIALIQMEKVFAEKS